MQENVEFRSVSRVIGYIHFVLSILVFIGNIIVIAFVSYVLANPSFLDSLDPHTQANYKEVIHYGVLGIIFYIYNLLVTCIDMWISKGLITATHLETSIYDALPLASRWRLWVIIFTIVSVLFGFIINPLTTAVLGGIFAIVIRGLICYLVHRYIQSLEATQPANFGMGPGKV